MGYSRQEESQEMETLKAQAAIKIAGRNTNNLRYTDDTTLMAESEEELEPFDESEKKRVKKLA